MEKRQSYLKKIFCFFLVGCILSSSMFFSYSNTLEVRADYFDDAEVFRTAVDMGTIVLGLVGIWFGGVALTPGFVLSSIITLWGGADLVAKNLTENEDGTYTINEELVNIILDKMDDVKNLTFNDDHVYAMGKVGYTYTVYGWSTTKNAYKDIFLTSARGSYQRHGSPDDPSKNRIAGHIDSVGGLWFYGRSGIIGTVSIPVTMERYKNGVLESTTSKSLNSISTNESPYVVDAAYSVNFPVFRDFALVENYLNTGDGYKDAINYAEKPPVDIGGSYTGTWNGGNITVSRHVLDGVADKVEELNNTDMDTDEKINQLVIFINGGDDGTGGGNGDDGTGGGDGSGTDDGETVEGDTWHEKIFNVLLKILEKIRTVPADIAKTLKLDAAHDNIKGVLDDILKAVRSIRRWVIADTIIDGLDFVESLISDVTGTVSGIIKEPLGVFKSVMLSLEALGDALKVKFPFCIPWDVAFLLGLFRAEPKPPHYEFPIRYGGDGSLMAIDQIIVIDFGQFGVLSRICRTLLTVMFCKGLLDYTMKIVSMKEQEYDRS